MSRELTPQEAAERSLIKKYRKELWNPFIAAVKRYELIAPGDRIAVCISGGKDSMVLAKLMQELQRHTEQPFELVFLVMDPGYAPANRALIEDAIADGVCAYRMVLAAGVDAEKIVFAGDSAGGLIATGTALAARDAGLQVPAGQILLSPLTSSDMNLKYNAMLEHRDVLFPFMAVKYLYDVFATKNGTHPVPEMPTEADLHGRSANSPYLGRDLPGRVQYTVFGGTVTVADGALVEDLTA